MLPGVSNSRHLLLFQSPNSSKLFFLLMHSNMASLFSISKTDSSQGLSVSLSSRLAFSVNNLLESSLFFSFGGVDYVCLASCDNLVHLYQLHVSPSVELEFLNSLRGHTNKIKEMAFALIDGKGIIASGSLDNYVRLWILKPVEELAESYKKSKYIYYANQTHFVMLESVLFGHTEGVSGVRFFRDVLGKSKPQRWRCNWQSSWPRVVLIARS